MSMQDTNLVSLEAWRPIGGAPRTRDWILLRSDHEKTHVPFCVGRWMDGKWDCVCHVKFSQPTHWAPLPEFKSQ